MSKKYASHSAQFKLKVAIEALKGTKTSAELCQEFGLSSSQIYAWKKQLEDAGTEVFSNKKKKKDSEPTVEQLHATIGKLKVENDFLSKALDL
jgi:transposase-like protein